MAAPQNIVTYGDFSAALLTSESYRRRRDGLDEGIFTLVDDSSETFSPGDTYNGFLIVGSDPTRIGEVWEHSLTCVGIKGNKPNRRLKMVPNHSLEGFDTASELWLTRNVNQVKPGDRLQGWPNMVCESASPEELEFPGWYRIQASYRGITRGKPIKRTISANVDISVIDNLVLVAGGGDATARKWAIAWPKVTVTFSYVRTGVELKQMPQQGGSPAGPLPTIQLALTTLPSGSDFTYNWPNGWRLMAMPIDEIPGTNICLVQEVWEWQQKVTV